MLLPLETGLKVQKNNFGNTVYGSHVSCLALKGQENLFWSKRNLFGFGLNFLCLSRDPLPISKVIKTFSYYWKKKRVWMKSVKSHIIAALFYCIRNNEFKVKSVSYRKINILRNSARNKWGCSQYLICSAWHCKNKIANVLVLLTHAFIFIQTRIFLFFSSLSFFFFFCDMGYTRQTLEVLK